RDLERDRLGPPRARPDRERYVRRVRQVPRADRRGPARSAPRSRAVHRVRERGVAGAAHRQGQSPAGTVAPPPPKGLSPQGTVPPPGEPSNPYNYICRRISALRLAALPCATEPQSYPGENQGRTAPMSDRSGTCLTACLLAASTLGLAGGGLLGFAAEPARAQVSDTARR